MCIFCFQGMSRIYTKKLTKYWLSMLKNTQLFLLHLTPVSISLSEKEPKKKKLKIVASTADDQVLTQLRKLKKWTQLFSPIPPCQPNLTCSTFKLLKALSGSQWRSGTCFFFLNK